MINLRNALMTGGGDTPQFWGLGFTAETPNATISLQAVGSAPAIYLETSFDEGRTWNSYTTGDIIELPHIGDRVCFAAPPGVENRYNSADNTGQGKYNHFVISGKMSASGSVMSYLKREESQTSISYMRGLGNLFQNCTGLTKPPELPATTLTARCYMYMFSGCTNLAAAPVLPAEEVYTNSYRGIMANCPLINEIRVGLKSFATPVTNWLANTSPTGTFYCPAELGTNETIQRGPSYCPEGWTVVNI